MEIFVFGLFAILYLILACVVVWVVFFQDGRQYFSLLIDRLFQLGRGLRQQFQQRSSRLTNGVRQVGRDGGASWATALAWMSKHKLGLSLSLALLLVPPLAVVVLGSGRYMDAFSDDSFQVNAQVSALLKGEQLVPPAPLPPELFMTSEVAQYRPMLLSADRNWQLLDSDFTQRLLLLFKIMREKHGYEMALLEGYRSPQRQDMLSQQGSHVTNAKAFQSYHQYGLAADCAFLRNGKLTISERDPWAMKGYELYGEVAESLGLTWGGRWKMMDFGHIELRKRGVMKSG